MRLFKLLAYFLIGYVLYEFFAGMRGAENEERTTKNV